MSKKRPPLIDILAKTPGANARTDAEDFVAKRRAELLGAPVSTPQQPEPDSAPGPAPIIENPDRYAEDFWQRFVDKQNAGKSPLGTRAEIVAEETRPPDKTVSTLPVSIETLLRTVPATLR